MRVQTFLRPVTLLHSEAFCVLCASCIAYNHLFPHHWAVFACLFLVPGLSLLLFVRGSNDLASVVYNLLHSCVLAVGLGGLVFLYTNKHFGEVSIIWASHISFDRMLGYGLKYPRDFKFTHLQSAGSHDAAG